MKKQFTLTMCLAFLFLFSTIAFGQMMRPGGGIGTHGMWNNYQVTPEQQKAFQEITDKYQPTFLKLADTIWAKRAQLNSILAQEKIDRKQTKILAKEVGALVAQRYELQVEMLADMREKGMPCYGMGIMGGGFMSGGHYYQDGGRGYPGMGQQGYGNRGMMQ